MSAMSDYLESGIIDHLFRGTALAQPSNISIALCSGDMSLAAREVCTGATLPELANNYGYARKDLGAPASAGNAVWSIPSGSVTPTTTNNNNLEFSQATGDWGHVSGIALVDSSTHGAGNVLMYGNLTTARVITSGDIFRFNAGDLDITLA